MTRSAPRDETTAALDRDILAFIARGLHQPRDDKAFNALALRLFAYQFERNTVYGRFCTGRKRIPGSVLHWSEVPAVPAMAFKELPLACFPIERAVAVYMSSGTTGTKRSHHYLDTLELYEASMMTNFKACVLPDRPSMPMLVLMPPANVLPNSSLGHMLERVKESLGDDGSSFFIDAAGLRADALTAALREAERTGTAVAMLGTAFSFVHYLDYCRERGLRFGLPSGSRIMDTGGFKGRSREVSKTELLALYASVLGVPEDYLINEYGMSEMGSQFYDNCLALPSYGGPRQKLMPPWVRSEVVDPETLAPSPDGSEGILRHFDLANRGSVMAIQTEDLAIASGDGFEVLGRLAGAEARGCSIMIDEMLSQNG